MSFFFVTATNHDFHFLTNAHIWNRRSHIIQVIRPWPWLTVILKQSWWLGDSPFSETRIYYIYIYMEVSWNRGTPQIILFNGIFHYKLSIWGYPSHFSKGGSVAGGNPHGPARNFGDLTLWSQSLRPSPLVASRPWNSVKFGRNERG